MLETSSVLEKLVATPQDEAVDEGPCSPAGPPGGTRHSRSVVTHRSPSGPGSFRGMTTTRGAHHQGGSPQRHGAWAGAYPLAWSPHLRGSGGGAHLQGLSGTVNVTQDEQWLERSGRRVNKALQPAGRQQSGCRRTQPHLKRSR